MLILYSVFLTWLFLEILYYVRIPKQIFNCEKLNYITISDCSEAAVHSHPFSKVSPENTGGRALLLVKLQTDCLEQRFYTRMTSPRIFSWKYFLSFQSALISQIVNILGKFLVAKVTSCGFRTFAYMKQIFPGIIFFSSQEIFERIMTF